MIRKPLVLKLDEDLEARPIALLVQEANQYASSVYIELENKRINAKSIMGMMSLALNNGEKITVVADGADEEDAILGVENFLMSKN